MAVLHCLDIITNILLILQTKYQLQALSLGACYLTEIIDDDGVYMFPHNYASTFYVHEAYFTEAVVGCGEGIL